MFQKLMILRVYNILYKIAYDIHEIDDLILIFTNQLKSLVSCCIILWGNKIISNVIQNDLWM